ncbi:MAG: hypothetical protein JWO74_3307 [Solirubrobacterales bacterium]|jgi:hypothetical protein|nr:hypothetical protein [Solirubrobacterales bacterium]
MERPARIAVVPAALAAALALAAPAGAKEISALTLCGTGGRCHPVPGGDRVRQAFMDGGSFITNSPDRRAPFFSVVATITEPGQRGAVGSYTVRWVPSAGRIRSKGEFDRPMWTRPDAATTRALRRAARGLEPKPAARLGALYVPPPKAKVTEVVNPQAHPQAAALRAPATAILVTGGAVLAAAVAAGAIVRRRRRTATGGSAPRLG